MNFTAGIDVSAWQPKIDWSAARQGGVRFAFMKATEGLTYIDKTFAPNWLNTKRAGIVRGAYHYLLGGMDAVQQADLFLKTVQFEDGDLPPALDLENTGNENVSNATMVAAAEAWLNRVAQVTNKTPMIYSGPFFLRDRITRPVLGPPLWAKKYPLWIANYVTNYHDGSMPVQPSGWQDWKFWQYTKTGHVAGIDGAVDLDWFRGSVADLYAFVGSAPAEPAVYVVKVNDSLQSIAKQYGVALLDLLDLNPQLLTPGMTLKIPTSVADNAQTNVPADTPSPSPADPPVMPGFVQYTVKSGDNLSLIAVHFKTSVDKIVAENRLANPDKISVGQVLKIPVG